MENPLRVRLSPERSRALAVALLVVTLVVVLVGGVLPLWRSYHAHQTELENYRERIERLSRVAANRTRFVQQLEQLEKRRDLSRYLLAQRSETLAAAALQEQLKRIVESSGGRLTSTRILPAQTAGDFLKVSVGARMSVSTEALQQVLYDVESNVPYLMVDKLTVRSRSRRTSSRSRRPRPRPLVQGPLDVRFDLTGFMLADTS